MLSRLRFWLIHKTAIADVPARPEGGPPHPVGTARLLNPATLVRPFCHEHINRPAYPPPHGAALGIAGQFFYPRGYKD
jgi:hypothetical protein